MNTNCLNLSAALSTAFTSGGLAAAQSNASASSFQPDFQSNAAASQMVPLMMQMQPGGSINLVPFQAQTPAQGIQQPSQWLGTPSPQLGSSQAHFMPNASGFASGSPTQVVTSMNELMALAAAMQQASAEVPVGSVANDEEILIKALRKGVARGLTYEQALRGLHNRNRHTETAWKNYFLTHLDRLYPKVCARKEGRFHPETSSGPVKQPLYLIKDDSQSARSAMSNTTKHEKPWSAAYGHKSPSTIRQHSGPRSEHTSSDRHKRTSSHVQHLPFLSAKGKRADVSLASRAGKSSGICIKKPRIRRRIARSPTPTPTPTPELSGVASSSDSDREPEARAYIASDGSDSESEYWHAQTGTQGPQKVTEEDFRAMARYIHQNPRDEGESLTGLAFWREFACRKENAERRSLDAWARAARTHQDKITLYVEEYVRVAEKTDDGDSEDEDTTPPVQGEEPTTDSTPQHTSPSVLVENTMAKRTDHAEVIVPRKRGPSPGRVGNLESPDEKRAKKESCDARTVGVVAHESRLEASSGKTAAGGGDVQ